MDFKLKHFSELSVAELYDLLKLRAEVFVVEQNCAYLDTDDKDTDALHLLGYEGGKLVGYARLLKPGVSYKQASIGRVVVHSAFRKKKAGYELMKRAISACLEKFHVTEIIISAQQYLERFYNNLGFVTESDMYLEDDIPHIKMRYSKTQAVS